MPRIPTRSPVTGAPLPPHYIHTLDSHFVDQSSRVRILRGVNLCGSSKTPVGKPSWVLDGFWEAVEAADGDSFVGRPLELTKDELRRMETDVSPIEFGSLGDSGEADVHLARLRGWGFTLLRFVFTWEALEHAGPGKYDEDFISQLILVLQKCKEHGFLVFLDPHQDVWSRFTGGSGAPYWTLLACGINPRSLTATQAAMIHNEYPVPSSPEPQNFPKMIWGTNYSRLAAQTLFTLFFAGKEFAPKCVIDGVNIQDYLQSHFINAVVHLAERIRETGGLFDECIIGWDSMNEPSEGLVGYEDVRKIPPQQALKMGSTPTVAQSLRLGMGRKQTDIEWWSFGSFGPRRNGSVDIDPLGVKLWVEADLADEHDGLNGRWGWKRSPEWKLGECIWALHGVWDPSLESNILPNPSSKKVEKDGDVLFPDYFLYHLSDSPEIPNTKVNFMEDHFRPHIKAYFEALRQHQPELIPFVQPPVFHPPPWLNTTDPDDPSSDLLQGRGCFSTHYYDGLTLMTRHWNWFNADALGVLRGKYSSPVFAVKIGEKAIRKSIREQLGVLKADCADRMGAYPTVFGEIGIPMELDDGYAYGGKDGKGKGKHDYREHVKAMDASLYGTDGENMLGFTIWTYCPDGTHKWGDGWNGEDLSLWCLDDERAHGSITGRRGLTIGKKTIAIPVSDRDQKDRARMEVRAAGEEEEADGDNASTDEEEQSTSPSQILGYQVSSPSLSLSDLVKPASTSKPPTLSDPTSSRATLLPSYAKIDAGDSGLASAPTLAFPAFRSSPLAFAFLTNGARAWRAFVRPYPLAVVGSPRGWEWDCNRAVFEMKVCVSPGDRSMLREKTSQIPKGDPELFVNQEEATEIFVPLLQFAKNDVVKRAFGIPGTSSTASLSASKAPPTPNTVPNPVTVPLMEDNSTVSLSIDSTKAKVLAMDREHTAATLISDNLEEGFDMEDCLDLEVSVNAGRWSVEGQVLKWWYPIPTASSSQATPQRNGSSLNVARPAISRSGSTMSLSRQRPSPVAPTVKEDGTIEYIITISRRGGAVDFKKLGVPESWVGMGPREDAASKEKKKSGQGGRKPDCCGDGCLIA